MTSYIKKVITYLFKKFVIIILGALVPFILIFKKLEKQCRSVPQVLGGFPELFQVSSPDDHF
mgnify:CR=1 FL=1